MNTERIKIDLSNLIKVVFQNQGFDSDLIEDLDFIEDLGMDSIIEAELSKKDAVED